MTYIGLVRKLKVWEKIKSWGPYQGFDNVIHVILVFGNLHIEIAIWTWKANFEKATWRSFFNLRFAMCLLKMQKAN